MVKRYSGIQRHKSNKLYRKLCWRNTNEINPVDFNLLRLITRKLKKIDRNKEGLVWR